MSNNNSTGAKAFGGVVAIIAVITGMYSMIQPMSQRIDFLERQVQAINKHTSARLHVGAEVGLAQLNEQLASIRDKNLKMQAKIAKLQEAISRIKGGKP